jgi:ATP-binding cassette subfamily B protein
MKLLLAYLKQYRNIVFLALGLATINTVFSLMDPLIFRHVIDDYASRFKEFDTTTFFKGVGFLLFLSMTVAFVSRVAKNFQDYYINVITQRIGAKLYADGISHSLQLPYQVFEDQRSGETLSKLQKVRADVEKLIATTINILFTSLVGFAFVTIYAFMINWVIGVVYAVTAPIIGTLSYSLSRKIKRIQVTIVAQTVALAGTTTESLRNIEARDRPTQRNERESIGAGTDESEIHSEAQLFARHDDQLFAHEHSLLDALSHFRARDHVRKILFALDLFVLLVRTAARAWKRD